MIRSRFQIAVATVAISVATCSILAVVATYLAYGAIGSPGWKAIATGVTAIILGLIAIGAQKG